MRDDARHGDAPHSLVRNRAISPVSTMAGSDLFFQRRFPQGGNRLTFLTAGKRFSPRFLGVAVSWFSAESGL